MTTHVLRLINSKNEITEVLIDKITDLKWSNINGMIVANIHTTEHGPARLLWPIDKVFLDDKSLKDVKIF